MISDKLYERAEKQGITVMCGVPLPLTKSVSIADGDDLYIGIDDSAMQTRAEERVHLAHEIAHCETASFYSLYSPVDNRGRCERRAKEHSYRMLVDGDKLRALIAEEPDIGLWELAEIFDVTEAFMREAVAFYI